MPDAPPNVEIVAPGSINAVWNRRMRQSKFKATILEYNLAQVHLQLAQLSSLLQRLNDGVSRCSNSFSR
jgi:hypothetical protein